MPPETGSTDGDPIPTTADSAESAAAAPASTGSIAAIDHMAGWARFGDTKATILAAGVGVVATMFTNSAPAVLKALDAPCPVGLLVGAFASLTVLSFMWTLFWVVRAIAPRSDIAYPGLNRFAWPSVIGATADQLVRHAQENDVEKDAWQQVVDLAVIAQRKFRFCKLAVYGFGVTVAAGVFTVLLSSPFIPPNS